jgi:hypothetical protein
MAKQQAVEHFNTFVGGSPAKCPLTFSFVMTLFIISFTAGSSACTVRAASLLNTWVSILRNTSKLQVDEHVPAINQSIFAKRQHRGRRERNAPRLVWT